MANETAAFAEEAEKIFGAAPEQIERLTVLMTAVSADSVPLPLVLLALNKPYEKALVGALAGEGAKGEAYKGHTLFVGPERKAVGLVGPRAYVMGNVEAVRALFDQADAKRDGPLAEARRLVLEKHSVVAALHAPRLSAQIPELPGEAEALQPLLMAKSATLVADLGTESRATLRLTFAGAAEAKKGAGALKAALDLARRGLAEVKKEQAKREGAPPLGSLFDRAIATLGKARIEQDGAAVRAVAAEKLDAAALTPLFADLMRRHSGASARIQSYGNLSKITYAMAVHADTYGRRFPTQAIFDKAGKPLLSWRVLILPLVGEEKLFKEFHLDEPWDSDHNKKLLDRMPKVYVIPGQKESNKTHYQCFYGKGAAFEGKTGLRFPVDFPDGTFNTLLVVEAADAVPWTKPEDLPYDPDKPLPKLGGLFPDGFHAATCDGSVRFIPAGIKPETLHLLIRRNDGQVIPDF
jgi:hypothetical protein